MHFKPSIASALQAAIASGRTCIETHRMPCGSKLFRLDNFDILKSDPDGASLGRLMTSDWEGAKKGHA